MLIFLIVFYLLTSISLYFIFPKANQPATKALIPVVNILTGLEIVGRPKWHVALFFIPIVNIFIYSSLAIDLIQAFGKNKFWHWVAVVLAAPIYFFWLAQQKDASYIGQSYKDQKEFNKKLAQAKKEGKAATVRKLMAKNPYKKSMGREWAEAIIFAVFAAAFLRMFLFEAYIIPTPSMEGSLKQGDFLFVSKMAYGVRMPQTILMVPLLHNRIPILGTESYLKKPQLKYRRTAAFETIDINDPIVFNWPVGDSVYLAPGRSYSAAQARRNPNVARQVRGVRLRTRPVDKKDHYIKRCVGTAGDSLQIINRTIYINGKPIENSQYVQFLYRVQTKNALNKSKLKEIGVHNYDIVDERAGNGQYLYYIHLSDGEKETIKKWDPSAQFQYYKPDGPVWPYADFSKDWTVDNFGPIFIPAAGSTIELTPRNLKIYAKAINDYEDNDLEIKNGQAYINGEKADSYTFKQNYYWGMGDNRHASEDSRMWGFIPEDHMVGKPSLIWMSLHEARPGAGINWKRVFKSADIF